MPEPFRLDGGNELLDTLGKLPLTVQKPLLRKAATDALEPIAKAVKVKAPVLWGDLEQSLIIGTKLNRTQASINRVDRSVVEVHFGTNDPAGMFNEFGTSKMAAQPFFREAWEAGKRGVLSRLQTSLGALIVIGAAKFVKRGGRL